MKFIIFGLCLLMLMINSAYGDVTLNPEVDQNIPLRWVNPTEYHNDDTLPPENILRTIVERSSDGLSWSMVAEIDSPALIYNDPTAPLGEGVYSYRIFTVVVGNLVSDSSNIVRATLFVPKQSKPPVLILE